MRVVTYARVSTIGQETEGQSLQNQERAFSRALDARGWTRIRAYREAASAGTVEGRAEFSRMMAELGETKPDCIVVDTLDRFTRNVKDGLVLLDEMHARGVRLLPLDWRRDKPIDLQDDRDWADVMEEFTSAERERRKIRRRVLRSFEGRRERGATTVNKPAFGLVKVGDRLVPDPDRAWVVVECERRILEGGEFGPTVEWARSIDARAWKTRSALRWALENASYVEGGVRDEARQAALTACLRARDRFAAKTRKHDHEFAGVFRCGECGRLMSGHQHNGDDAITCKGGPGAEHWFYTAAFKITPLWRRYIEAFEAPEVVATIAAEGTRPRPERRKLERRLAKIDQESAALKARRDRALDLLMDSDPGVVRQVRGALADLDRDETALWAAREAILGELAAVPAPKTDAAAVTALLEKFGALYETATTKQRNAMNRALCAALGSHPILRREGEGGRGSRWRVTYALKWPGVDELLRVTSRSR